MIPAAIFDVDGTLVDVSAVRHHVAAHPRRFDLFHGEAIDCPPHPVALALVRQARAEGLAVLVVTGRREEWSFHTLLWLRENGVEHDALFMRGQFDNRPDVVVKAAVLVGLRHLFEIRYAVDDNPAVVRLWEENGIPTITIPGWR